MNKRTERSLRIVACHEAGHAVMAVAVGIALKKVTIVPSGDAAGRCHHEEIAMGDDADDSPRGRLRIEKMTMISLAGISSAQRIWDARTVRHWRATSDYKRAMNASTVFNGNPRQCEAWLRWIAIGTEDYLRLWWSSVEALSEELFVRRTMKGDEARKFIVDNWR